MNKGKLKIKSAVKIFAAVVLLAVILTSTASADILGTTKIENHRNNLSDTGRLWGGSLDGGPYYTGIYSWDNNTVGSTGFGQYVPDWGFCIELTQGAYNGAVDVIYLEEAPMPPSIYGTPMGPTKADYIRELWGRFFDSSWLTGGTANKQMGEAFGAAVWEIIYEDLPASPADWDVTTDGSPADPNRGFKAASLDSVTANSWLHSLTGDEDFFDLNLAAISNGAGQDYLVRLSTPPPPIPEPATIAILGIGALSLIRRKK